MYETNVKNEKILETNVQNQCEKRKDQCAKSMWKTKKFLRNQLIFRKKYAQNRGGGSFTGDRGRFFCENFRNQCVKPMWKTKKISKPMCETNVTNEKTNVINQCEKRNIFRNQSRLVHAPPSLMTQRHTSQFGKINLRLKRNMLKTAPGSCPTVCKRFIGQELRIIIPTPRRESKLPQISLSTLSATAYRCPPRTTLHTTPHRYHPPPPLCAYFFRKISWFRPPLPMADLLC